MKSYSTEEYSKCIEFRRKLSDSCTASSAAERCINDLCHHVSVLGAYEVFSAAERLRQIFKNEITQ